MNQRGILVIVLLHCIPALLSGQNWSTFGGNSTRNGLSKITGPQNNNITYWSVTSSNSTTLGNAVYSFGDRFITSRVEFSPYYGVVECRNLQTGALEWTSPFISANSILYAVGYNEDGVYAHDYSTDTIYALNSNDGSIKWRGQITSQTFGAYPGCVFACNGDLIVNGPAASGKFTMRLNKNTGDTVWTNPELIAIGPAVGLAASATTVYRVTGGITVPILLTAIDINTGQTKYHSSPIPGDPDQENPITLGLNNEIYFWRDGGNLYSYSDNGSALVQNWTYLPQTVTGAALFGNISIGREGHLYVFDSGKVRRIDHVTGSVIDTTLVNINSGVISIGFDSTVYINNKSGTYFALTPDLQTVKWQFFMGGNTYCNMALSKDGIMVFTGTGTQIFSYRSPQNLPPVADFRASASTIATGAPLDFFDQSSYAPASWQWNFPGGFPSGSTQQHPTGIFYNAPGIYEVSLSVQNVFGGDSVLKSCYIEVVDPFGIAEAGNQNLISVYPNPAVSEIVIVYSEPGQNTPLIITDITGRTILKAVTIDGMLKTHISAWEPGVYFVRKEQVNAPAVKFIRAGW